MFDIVPFETLVLIVVTALELNVVRCLANYRCFQQIQVNFRTKINYLITFLTLRLFSQVFFLNVT